MKTRDRQRLVRLALLLLVFGLVLGAPTTGYAQDHGVDCFVDGASVDEVTACLRARSDSKRGPNLLLLGAGLLGLVAIVTAAAAVIHISSRRR